MFPRLILVLIPFLISFTGGFALLHLYRAFVVARTGNLPVAAIYGLLGFAGIVLTTALWRVRRQIRRGPA